jgi:uncharacterized protein (DUF342 family)
LTVETTQSFKAAIKVQILQKGLEAWMRVVPPMPVPVEQLLAALHQNGVVFGIDEKALVSLATNPVGDGMLVARGTPPSPGTPARVEYYFSADPINVGPVEADGGRVDYREGRVIQNVVEGQVLARKIPGIPGTPGSAVTGQPIPPLPIKEIHLLAGKNVELSPDKLEVVATVTGVPMMERNRISVRPVFTVDEVDFSVGNINFQGSVVVKGGVNAGFTIRATEDVEVRGYVEGGLIQAGGSVMIKGGVRNHAIVEAQGDVTARFVDSESSISARRDITIQSDALHSTLSAGKRILIGGHLIGGLSKAGEFVQAGSLGTPHETPTRIEINQDPPDDLLDQLHAEEAQLVIDLDEITSLIKTVMANPPQDGPFNLQRLMPQKVNMSLRLAQIRQQIIELESEHEELPLPKIVVKGESHAGVVMMLNRKVLRLERSLYGKTFSFVEGEIQY